jgi:hypothetical protein
MKRLQEGDSLANTGFANQFFHPLSQVNQFESVPSREIKHMPHDNWCESDAGKLVRVFGLGGFKFRFHSIAIACPPFGNVAPLPVMLTILGPLLHFVKYFLIQSHSRWLWLSKDRRAVLLIPIMAEDAQFSVRTGDPAGAITNDKST